MTELQTKWIEALRSGKYKQGKGRLRDGDKFCCLGVLCNEIDEDSFVDDSWRGHKYYLYEDTCDKVGISLNQAHRLSELNDANFTFDEIAEVLERMLLDLDITDLIKEIEQKQRDNSYD